MRLQRRRLLFLFLRSSSSGLLPLKNALRSASSFAGITAAESDAELDGDFDGTFTADPSNWTRRIRSLCSAQGVDEALHLLDRLRLRGYRPDSLCLASLLHSLCDAGRFAEAHDRLILAVASGWVPDDRTINALVSRLLAAGSPDSTLRALTHLSAAKPAFALSLANYNRLVHQLCTLSRPSDALKIFLEMKRRGYRPNAVSYTTLIDGFARAGDLEAARRLYDEMRERGVAPNSLTYSSLLKGVLRRRMVEEGRKMMELLWVKMESANKDEEEEDGSVKNAAFANLVDALCREGFFQELFRLAEDAPTKACVSPEFAYGQMIDSLCRVGKHHAASRIVYLMRKRGLKPSLVSFNNIVHGLSKQGEGGCLRAFQLLFEGARFGYAPPVSTYQTLVEGLCKIKHVEKARALADFMLGEDDDDDAARRTYNILLRALRLVGRPSEQLNVLVAMLRRRCRPDVVTLNTVVHGLCMAGNVDEALKILHDMLHGEFCAPDVVTFTTVIRGLLNAGRTEEAFDVLRVKMAESSCSPNTVTYNAVLCGLCKLGRVEQAMDILKEMTRKSVGYDQRTCAIVLDGLLRAGRVDDAKAFWEDVVWPSGIHDGFVYAAVLRGLCNLGRLDEACDFLYELADCGFSPGIVCYNIVIDRASKMNLKRQAYRLVAEMRRNGLRPDAVTWRILDKLHKRGEVGDRTLVHAVDPEKLSRPEFGLVAIENDGSSPEKYHRSAEQETLGKKK
ncbi:pentatricopeptide repeat (PPR) superfamily protein [Wolffia australiana]